MELRTTLLTSAAEFEAIGSQIECLRRRCELEDDVSLDPAHFLASVSREQRSCSVAFWQRDELVGVLFCLEQWKWGIRTGYVVGGDFTGRGLLLCQAEDEPLFLQAAIPCIIAHGNHSLHLRRVPRAQGQLQLLDLAVCQMDRMIRGDRMSLGESYEAFLASLGQHTRRNLRAYRRKTAEAGIRFDPEVGQEEFLRERQRLNALSDFPAHPTHLERDDRFMELHGGGWRMALRARDGSVVALICAFSVEDRFYLLTQWNDRSLERLSLSNVLRGYAVEYLIAQRFRKLIFVFGTSIAFGRFCEPQHFELLLVDRRRGISAMLKRLLATACRQRAWAGKPLPLRVEALAGGFLDRSRLMQWTALSHTLDTA